MYVELVIRLAQEGPEPNDVVAGWTAFAIFIGLFVVVAILGVSLTRRLKNVDRAEELGLYDPSAKTLRARREVQREAEREAEAATGSDAGEPDSSSR